MDGSQHPLAGIDWEDLYPRLVAYAVLLCGAHRLMSGTGSSADDLASGVVLDLMNGKIRYDPSRPLFPLLKKALFRDFLDQKKSAAHRTTVIVQESSDADGTNSSGLDGFADASEPADILFRKTVYDAIGQDQELLDLACAVLELNIRMPALIASALGISVDEVENRRKRLRRVLIHVRARLGA